MIKKLIVKNYLLIKEVNINFASGFNVITGETGAGKSILIDALGLLLGERADYSLILKNKERMLVEATIGLSSANKKEIGSFLRERNIEEFVDETILRREIYLKGYSRCFINDSPVNTSDLKQVGEMLVDIHSQNEHQSLLKKSSHLLLIDNHTKKKDKYFEKILESYKQKFYEFKKLVRTREELTEKKNVFDKNRSFAEFQLKEIEEVSPEAKEDENLEKELKASENTELINQILNSSYQNIYEGEDSAAVKIKDSEKELSKITEFDDELKELVGEIKNASNTIVEASRRIEFLKDKFYYDPARIEEIRQRLYKIQNLKRKFGGSIESVLEQREKLSKELLFIENFEESTKEIDIKISAAREMLKEKSIKISDTRKKTSEDLNKKISAKLLELGFEDAEFKVQTRETNSNTEDTFTIKKQKRMLHITENGIDDIEFIVRTNKGGEIMPLKDTASGGEISRVMLAIKTVFAEADNTSTLIFDEIDIGISGRIASKVGKAIKELSQSHQIISITHLAQIAALAEEHIVVSKKTEGEETITEITRLEPKEKILEVAKLLSGEKVTDASIKSAKELIES